MLPTANSPQDGNSNPLAGIIGAALNILPFVAPEIGIPARMALGALTTAAANGIEGKPQSLGQDIMGGISDGLMGGALGKAGGIAKGAAEDVAGGVAKDAAATGEGAIADGSQPDEFGYIANPVSETPAVEKTATTTPAVATPTVENPTNINPETSQGHVNFSQEKDGSLNVTPNTYTPTTPNEQLPQTTPAGTPAYPVDNGIATNQSTTNPVSGEAATSRYTPQQFAPQPQLSGAQSLARNEALNGMISTMQAAGMKVNNSDVNNLANTAIDLGYNDFPSMAKDSYTLTGKDQGVDNAVNNMVKQASVGDSNANPTAMDVSDVMTPGARESIVNQATRGTTGANGMGSAYTDAQRKTLQTSIQDQNVALAGAGKGGYRTLQEAVDAGDLVKSPTGGYELSSEAMKNVNPVDLLQVQRNFAQKAADAKTVGEKELFQGLANNLNDKLGQIAITKEGAQNVLTNLKESGFANSNPTQYARLQKSLQNGTISNINQLRSFTAPWVRANKAYSQATGGASIYDLAAGGRSGLSKGIMSSGTAGKLRVRAARGISNLTARPGAPTAFGSSAGGSNILNGTLGKRGGMSPVGRAAALAGILGGAGLVGNGILTANQGAQAQALLNDPTYQKTQSILSQSDALQRYLGEQGAIRSIFAPTFDSNAGQAGQEGQALLASANQNQSARQAALNLLQARSQMGQGGILGGILSLIPGTNQNAYAQQAANAGAQLNSLGVAGTAPGVMQSGSVIPSLTSMAGNVGNF